MSEQTPEEREEASEKSASRENWEGSVSGSSGREKVSQKGQAAHVKKGG